MNETSVLDMEEYKNIEHGKLLIKIRKHIYHFIKRLFDIVGGFFWNTIFNSYVNYY